jgi:DNA-binding CsgD family transcriptional regulator
MLISKHTTLTSRELDVLRLIAKGENQFSIAEILYISPDTSRARVKKLREKLDAATVAEAVYLAMKYNILE